MHSHLTGLVCAAVALIAAVWLFAQFMVVAPAAVPITNFEECAAAGNPVMESYPEQCRTADGRLFVREIPMPAEPQLTDCVVGGCSAQLCDERSEAENLVSTCEYRAEYACYGRFSVCERQPNGQCDWTPTPTLQQCLANPPEGGEEFVPEVEMQVI